MFFKWVGKTIKQISLGGDFKHCHFTPVFGPSQDLLRRCLSIITHKVFGRLLYFPGGIIWADYIFVDAWNLKRFWTNWMMIDHILEMENGCFTISIHWQKGLVWFRVPGRGSLAKPEHNRHWEAFCIPRLTKKNTETDKFAIPTKISKEHLHMVHCEMHLSNMHLGHRTFGPECSIWWMMTCDITIHSTDCSFSNENGHLWKAPGT